MLIFIFRVKRFCDYSAVVNFFFSPRGEKRGSISADNLAMFVARRWKRLVDGRKKAGVEKQEASRECEREGEVEKEKKKKDERRRRKCVKKGREGSSTANSPPVM